MQRRDMGVGDDRHDAARKGRQELTRAVEKAAPHVDRVAAVPERNGNLLAHVSSTPSLFSAFTMRSTAA